MLPPLQLSPRVRLSDRPEHRPHRLVGDAELPGDGPQPLPLRPLRDLRPALPRDARPFRARSVPANSRATSRPKHSIGIEERYKRRRHDVYLA